MKEKISMCNINAFVFIPTHCLYGVGVWGYESHNGAVHAPMVEVITPTSQNMELRFRVLLPQFPPHTQQTEPVPTLRAVSSKVNAPSAAASRDTAERFCFRGPFQHEPANSSSKPKNSRGPPGHEMGRGAGEGRRQAPRARAPFCNLEKQEGRSELAGLQ